MMTQKILAALSPRMFLKNMPRLPSGRVAAVNFLPLQQLGTRAEEAEDASLLLFLDQEEQFCAFIGIVEIEWRPDIPAEELDTIHTTCGAKACIITDTGYTLADFLARRLPWSKEDVAAFFHFLKTQRIQDAIKLHHGHLLSRRDPLVVRAIVSPRRDQILPRAAEVSLAPSS